MFLWTLNSLLSLKYTWDHESRICECYWLYIKIAHTCTMHLMIEKLSATVSIPPQYKNCDHYAFCHWCFFTLLLNYSLNFPERHQEVYSYTDHIKNIKKKSQLAIALNEFQSVKLSIKMKTVRLLSDFILIRKHGKSSLLSRFESFGNMHATSNTSIFWGKSQLLPSTTVTASAVFYNLCRMN